MRSTIPTVLRSLFTKSSATFWLNNSNAAVASTINYEQTLIAVWLLCIAYLSVDVPLWQAPSNWSSRNSDKWINDSPLNWFTALFSKTHVEKSQESRKAGIVWLELTAGLSLFAASRASPRCEKKDESSCIWTNDGLIDPGASSTGKSFRSYARGFYYLAFKKKHW